MKPAVPVAIDYWNEKDANRVVVEWTLGNTCNYACSYCPERLHDGSVDWVEANRVIRFCHQLTAHFVGKRVCFLLTGGEPTLHRAIKPILSGLQEANCDVAMLSNGSRSVRWWEQVRHSLDMVILSYHREFAELAHFKRVMRALAGHVALQVNIVMSPEHFEELTHVAEELFNECKDSTIVLKPLVDDWQSVADYTGLPVQLVGRELGPKTLREDSCLKSDLVLVRADGERTRWTPEQLLARGENGWQGWNCAIGVENLLIRFEDIYRGNCKVGGLLGKVGDADLRLPETPVACTKPACICLGDMKVRKWRKTGTETQDEDS